MILQELIDQGAIFYCSHSGGKDSQAMYSYLRSLVPDELLVVVHADLGEVEWSGVQDHILANIEHPLNVVHANWKDGSEKSLLGMVEKRMVDRPGAPSWPSSAARFCTSDLKRDPIAKFIRRDLKDRGKSLGVNCMGLRAEESVARAKRPEWSLNKRLSNQSREVFDWNPILEWSVEEVFKYIEDAGQEPFWAYQDGNERLSCVFCIMGSRSDLAHGAKVRPELFKKYSDLEKRCGYSMFKGESLAERAGIIASDSAA
jgi:DNA sulfur modification protein DndC